MMDLDADPLPEEDRPKDMIMRDYQQQLEEIAMQRNTIIHLPTGSGKTFIAARIISRLKKELQLPWGEGGKRAFFLVNTVPLVEQQKKVISCLSAVEGVAGFSSEDKVDFWKKDKWDEELAQNQVIVMTSQILSNMLLHSFINLEDINLLIFDECHHAVEDHPMRQIMKTFEQCPPNRQPRVIGLTATLLNSNVDIYKITDTIRSLETTFHATIATAENLENVLGFSTNPKELLMTFSRPVMPPVAEKVKAMLLRLTQYIMATNLPSVKSDIKLKKNETDVTRDPKSVVKKVANLVGDMNNQLDVLGLYGGSLGILAYIVLIERHRRKAETKEEGLFFKCVISHANMARKELEDAMSDATGYDKVLRYSSPQVLQMLNVLREYNPIRIKSNENLQVNHTRLPLCAIIFTRQRFTAKILYNLLKAVRESNPSEFGFLQHDFIVGFNVNPYNNTREQLLEKKLSQSALLQFTNKNLNCLIATSVIEEGIDIPQCSLVLRYDSPLDYRSYIQSKGRARSAKSAYVVLVSEKESRKFEAKYNGFQSMEKHLQHLLVGKFKDRNLPSEQELETDLYKDCVLPPYIAPSGARVSETLAIALMARYCSMLPGDRFTVIMASWILEKSTRNQKPVVRFSIIMPISCPIKNRIIGDYMFSQKSAKRSAALKACEMLHRIGELDEETLLPRRYSKVDFKMPNVRSVFPNWPWDNDDDEPDLKKVGTKGRKRRHTKLYPKCLDGPENWQYGQQKFYVHMITLKTAFKRPTESRERALYELLQQPEGFALLTHHPLPRLCAFPMYLTVGEVTTSLEVNFDTLMLDRDQFDALKAFHHLVFHKVLDVAKSFLVFDGCKNSMYVVPVRPAGARLGIDWDVVYTHKTVEAVMEPTQEERQNLKVNQSNYKYSVVTPWYRGLIMPDKYLVSNVLEYMTPQSSFGSDSDLSFAEYYSSRYNLSILGPPDQAMLEVRNISTRMNCLLMRPATLNTLTARQLRDVSTALGDERNTAIKEILVPEFCVKFSFPGVLWFKALILPSLIHRVTMLLTAEELRVEIARHTKLGQVELPLGEQWAPLTVNEHIATRSLLTAAGDTSKAPLITMDRLNQPGDSEEPRPVRITTMKESLYKLQMKKIGKNYPWEEDKEPRDIERNIATVTVMDIECYDEFVTAALGGTSASSATSPRAFCPSAGHAAIQPPPLKYHDEIKLLSQTVVGRGTELADVLSALTVIKSNDGFNLERAETLGDSFLKYAATLYLFHKFPTLNEGQLTNIKNRLIGNRNLYYAGERLQLGGRMKTECFSPRQDFVLPGFSVPSALHNFILASEIRPTFLIGIEFEPEVILSGELSAESWRRVEARYQDGSGCVETETPANVQPAMQCYLRAQCVADKVVADCVEALVGTYLVSCGLTGAVRVLEWMRVLPEKDDFLSLQKRKVPTAFTECRASAAEIDFLLDSSRRQLETILGYKFRDPSLLLEALSHPSFIRNRVTNSYERLEFLGDAVLDFLITSHLYEQLPNLKPGELTDLRSALVNNITFASYVVKLGLHKYKQCMLSPSLERAVMEFVEHQEQRNHGIIEEVLYLIDEEDCRVAEYVEVPKLLSDLFESLAGAIFLDSGGDLPTVWRVYYRIMCREIESFSANVPIQPVRQLRERIHACPMFGESRVVDEDRNTVMVPVTVTKNGSQVTVHGCGRSKAQASRAAAKLALKTLGVKPVLPTPGPY